MLVLAVALGSGAVFASFTIARGIQASIDLSFARMGADLIVLPAGALVNITSALLTVQPTDATLPKSIVGEIARINGVAGVAPQTIYRVPVMAGMPEHKVNLIAFDPSQDFTVNPWLVEHLPRAIRSGDLLSGARREESVGDELEPCGIPSVIYGKLGRSGVGPFEESLFASFGTVARIAKGRYGGGACIPHYDPDRISAALVRLGVGATPEQVRFAIGQLSGVKVVTGSVIVTSTRQTMTALIAGIACFMVLMLLGSFLMISLLFSAIISERRREVGLLGAIGARRNHIARMLLTEAAFVTTLGGVCGIAFGGGLLLLFQRSLVYYLETLHLQFVWPYPTLIMAFALICTDLASLVGLVGALVPALRTSREEPFALIQSEGG